MIYRSADQIIVDDVFLSLGDFVRGSEVLLKLEGLNPAGSIKLKTAVAMIDAAEHSGRLQAGGTIIESSSGNLGVALSIAARVRGYTFICVTDTNATPAHVKTMRTYGTDVVVVDRRADGSGSLLAARLDYLHDYRRRHPDVVWLDQYGNANNSRVHAQLTATAILANIPCTDYLFVGLGSTGTFMGCAEKFRTASPKTRIIAVDVEGSVILGEDPAPRHIPGIGAAVRPKLFDGGLADDALIVDEAAAIRMCRHVATAHGLMVGGSTGSILAAVRRYGPRLPPGSTVVAICPDLGDRYIDLLYSDQWVSARYGPIGAEVQPRMEII